MATKLGRMYRSEEDGLNDIELKKSILELKIEIEALFRVLIDKELVTRREINKYRNEVTNGHNKYTKEMMDINCQRKDILDPPIDPEWRAMIQAWIEEEDAKTVGLWPTCTLSHKKEKI